MKTKLMLAIISVTLTTNISLADIPVPATELRRAIIGKTVAFGSRYAVYYPDGTYSYAGADPGQWRVSTGRICVDFDNGRARCDRIVKDNGKLYFINGRNGARFVFRPQKIGY